MFTHCSFEGVVFIDNANVHISTLARFKHCLRFRWSLGVIKFFPFTAIANAELS